MLVNPVIGHAVELGSDFANKDKSIQVGRNGIFGALCRNTYTHFDDRLVINNTVIGVELESRIDSPMFVQIMDDVVKAMSDGIKSISSIINTEVLPEIKKIVEDTSPVYTDFKDNAIDGYDIIEEELPAVLVIPALYDGDVANASRESTFKPLKTTVRINTLTTSNYSEDIREWWDDCCSDVTDAFHRIDMGQCRFSDLKKNAAPLTDYGKVNYYTAILISAKNALTTIPDNMEGTTLTEYRYHFKNMVSTCYFRINSLLRKIQTNRKLGYVITRRDTTKNKIYVCSKTYDSLLKSGGTVESLLGALISGFRGRSVKMLLDNTLTLERKWKRHVSILQRTSDQRLLTRFKEVARQSFMNSVKSEMTPIEEEYFTSNDRTYIIKRGLEFIKMTKMADLESIDRWAMELVCTTRFYYTDAYTILRNMDEVSKHDPDNVSYDTAFFLAIVEHVGEYLADLITVTDV